MFFASETFLIMFCHILWDILSAYFYGNVYS